MRVRVVAAPARWAARRSLRGACGPQRQPGQAVVSRSGAGGGGGVPAVVALLAGGCCSAMGRLSLRESPAQIRAEFGLAKSAASSWAGACQAGAVTQELASRWTLLPFLRGYARCRDNALMTAGSATGWQASAQSATASSPALHAPLAKDSFSLLFYGLVAHSHWVARAATCFLLVAAHEAFKKGSQGGGERCCWRQPFLHCEPTAGTTSLIKAYHLGVWLSSLPFKRSAGFVCRNPRGVSLQKRLSETAHAHP